MTDQAAGARLRHGDGVAALAEQSAHDLFHRRVPFGVHVGRDALVNPCRGAGQALFDVVRRSCHGYAHRDLRKGRTERDLALALGESTGNQLVQGGLADSERLKHPARVHFDCSTRLREPGQDCILHHALHLARHSGQRDQVARPELRLDGEPEPRRRAEGIGEHFRTFGEPRLLQVVLGHRAVHRSEDLPDARRDFIVLHQPAAREARHGLRGPVIDGRAEPTGRDHQLG